MRIPPVFLRFCLACSACLVIVSAAVLETNVAPADVSTASQAVVPDPVVIAELDELQEQLRTMQESNEEMQRSSQDAAQKWEAMSQQNSALSNVLTGLQQTLITQRERELELSRQSNSLMIKVISGAAVAVFLVFLFSYWFQLRCLNRVMEISRSVPGLPDREPMLLEQENPATSKLLAAMKMLEHRLEHLEVRDTAGENGEAVVFPEASHARTLLNSHHQEPSASSNVTLLMAKGQVLLDTERLQEAANCFQEVISIDPTNSEAHLKKGVALERMSRFELALNAYDEALRLNPKRVVANVYKARVLASLHRYDEAISAYDSALGRNSTKVETPIFAS